MRLYKLSEPAERDLTEIWVYIAEENQVAADKVRDQLVDCFHLLGKNPKLGIEQSEIRTNLRSFVYRNYVIFYNEVDVEIYRVLHGSRDIRGIFYDPTEGDQWS